jgi:hypothetical protein
MARTTKRARTKVPPVIAKLLKAVNDLPLEDAVDELQLAWEDETSLEKRQTLMKARIKLLEDAQKPRKGAARPRKKPARKPQVEEAEVIEEAVEATEEAPTKKRGGTGTVTAMDLDGLGSILGGGDDAEGGENGAAEGGDATPGAGAGGTESDLDVLASLSDATNGDGTGADAANGAIAMPPPDQPAAEPEAPKEPEKPAYKQKKLNAPDYAGDEMYQQIWKEMQQEGIDKLTAVRMSGDDFDTRLEQTRKDADWLGFGAIRMGDSEWDQAANSIVFDCDHITADWQLDQRLNQGLSEMAALQGADAPDLPEVEVPDGAEAAAAPAPAPAPAPETPAEPAPEPEPTPEPAAAEDSPPPAPKAAAVDPMANMDALFAELGGDEEEAVAEATEEPEQEPVAEAPKEEAAAAPAPAAEAAPEPEPEPEPEPAPEAQPEPAAEVTTTAAADAENASEATTDMDADAVIPTNEAGEKILTEDRYDVSFDPTPIEHFHDDPQYMEIWEAMVVEALENLGLAQRWKAAFDARLRRVDDTAARLLHAAQQMQFEDYVHLLEDFTFDLPALCDDSALDAAIGKVRDELQTLRGDKPAVTIPAEDTYTPPAPKSQTMPGKAPSDPADQMRTPPKPMVTDTDESAQTRDDWEDEDFWSWDDDDAEPPAEQGTTASPSTAAEPAAPPAPEAAAAPTPAPADPVTSAPAQSAEAPVSTFDQDEGFRGVWDDMVQETLEGLRLNRASDAPLDDRLSRTTAQVDRLRHAAEQMDYGPWVDVLKTFGAKSRLIGDNSAFQTALDRLLDDLTLLHKGSAAVADLFKKPADKVSTTVEEARAAAQSRSGKATLEDIYKFFPKPE